MEQVENSNAPTTEDLIARIEALQAQRNEAQDIGAVMRGNLKVALIKIQQLENQVAELTKQLEANKPGE